MKLWRLLFGEGGTAGVTTAGVPTFGAEAGTLGGAPLLIAGAATGAGFSEALAKLGRESALIIAEVFGSIGGMILFLFP